jgi:phosphatidylcholine synthase
LTASGAAWGVLALVAAGDGRFRAALAWMAVAVIVDAADGPLARVFRVDRVLPSIDGSLLDNVVDYLNYVIVPAYLMLHAGVLPRGTALAAVCAVAVGSAFQFAHRGAKSEGDAFRGFPCYWNVAAFYLLSLRPDPRLALASLAVMLVLLFVPILYVHPARARALRPLSLALTALWAASVLFGLLLYPDAPRRLLLLSGLYFPYYLALSLVRTVGPRARTQQRLH